jgi:hypothetical protein
VQFPEPPLRDPQQLLQIPNIIPPGPDRPKVDAQPGHSSSASKSRDHIIRPVVGCVREFDFKAVSHCGRQCPGVFAEGGGLALNNTFPALAVPAY